MRCIVALISCLLLGMSVVAKSAERTAFAGYTLLSQQVIQHTSTHLHFGLMEPVFEHFALRYEYSFVQSMSHVEMRQRLGVTAHSFMVAGQQELFDQLFVWGGTSLAVIEGKLREWTVDRNVHFRASELQLQVELGFGQSWKLAERYQLGVDWLVISLPIERQTKVHDRQAIEDFKGPSFSMTEEVEKTYLHINTIRGLRVQASLLL